MQETDDCLDALPSLYDDSVQYPSNADEVLDDLSDAWLQMATNFEEILAPPSPPAPAYNEIFSSFSSARGYHGQEPAAFGICGKTLPSINDNNMSADEQANNDMGRPAITNQELMGFMARQTELLVKLVETIKAMDGRMQLIHSRIIDGKPRRLRGAKNTMVTKVSSFIQ
jgi:hypothetical protein